MNSELFQKLPLMRTDKDDPRGHTFKMLLDGKEYLFLYIHKGAFRGGHYHSSENFHLVLQGRIQFEFVDPSTEMKKETIAGPMDIVRIPAGVAHLLKALEDSLFMEPSESLTEEFPPQRSFVKAFLRSRSG